MGCGGDRDRERGPPEQKARWDFIELKDFRSSSPWTGIGYGWLWFMAFVSVAVYAVDTFTAVNLLVFDKWSSQVKPWVPFKYSKWIFAGCILFSWVLCVYEWMRAIRVIKRNGVAASYMDPLAASLQGMRSQGWRRFLVFKELTKSKKGTDYVAFFVYFAFQGAIRILLAEAPRQVINMLTLGSIMETKMKGTDSEDHSTIVNLFLNIKALAEENHQQAVILGSMLFTLVIWIFSALCLIAATILYLVFLWHYIPKADGRLRIYCRRKIDRRLEKIVEYKVKAAIEDENRRKEKAEKKAELKRQKTGGFPPAAPPKLARQPTLPVVGESPELRQDEKLEKSPLTRQDTTTTVSTLPVYSSRPPTRQTIQRQPTLPDIAFGGERPTMPTRSGTQGSAWSKASFESNAPLLANAGYAGGDGRSASQAPMYSRQNSNGSFRPIPGRTNTQSTQASQRSFATVSRMDTAGSQQSNMSRPPPGSRFPVRSQTGYSFDHEAPSEISPTSPFDARGQPFAPLRVNTADSFRPESARQASQTSSFSRPMAATPAPGLERQPTYGSLHSQQSFSRPMPRKPSQGSNFHRPFTPAQVSQDQPTPGPNSYEMTSQPYSAPPPPSAGGYVAFSPSLHGGPSPVSAHPSGQRNITVTGAPGTGGNYFGNVQGPQRSVTAPIDQRAVSSYDDILDDYGGQAERYGEGPVAPPPRAYTAGPNNGGWR